MYKVKNKYPLRIEYIVLEISKFSGSNMAIIIALLIVILWTISGPVLKYSEAWQSVIYKGMTMITFLMVFIIQRAQNKDSLAIQLKLNELISATKGASNKLVDVEELSEKELVVLKDIYTDISSEFKKVNDLKISRNEKETKGTDAGKSVKMNN